MRVFLRKDMIHVIWHFHCHTWVASNMTTCINNMTLRYLPSICMF